MADINLIISIIILNFSGLHKREIIRVDSKNKTQLCFQQETPFKYKDKLG